MITISATDVAVATLLFAVFMLIVNIVLWMRVHPNATPAQLDTEVTNRIDAIHSEHIATLESFYQQQSDVFKHSFDLLTTALRLVAPLTPGNADDAVSRFLDDVQTPGAPPTTVTTTVTTVTPEPAG